MGKSFDGLKYTCTNESIFAAHAGLVPEEKDFLVSIGSSGCVGFSFTPYVNRICLVDSNEAQISFIEKQIGFLMDRDWENFLGGDSYERARRIEEDSCCYDSRKEFFEGKLEDVRNSLGKIELVHGDIFETLDRFSSNGERVDKVYLSNALDYTDTGYTGLPGDKGIDCLVSGGLVYDSGEFGLCHSQLRPNRARSRAANSCPRIGFWNWEYSVYEKK